MRFQSDLWQGSCEDWIDHFIDQNLVVIGYAAWEGYIRCGSGLVVCQIPPTISTRWQVETMSYELRFIRESQLINYLQGLKLDSETIATLLETIATYDPVNEIIILLKNDDQIDIDVLQRLAMSPPACHVQVLQRWSEFQPCLTMLLTEDI